MKKRSLLSLLLLAGLMTCLNAGKPLHIDDAAYYYYARQIAYYPRDPYGFTLLWYDEPTEANDLLAPPVLPAWWALQLRLFNETPWLWKLGLLPWCFLLTLSLEALFRRFTPGLEGPLTWLTVLSPALLPSLNLMLDVPALALSLGAITVFLRACDRGSLTLALLAGLLAGIATETKYTGFLAPGVMLLVADTRRRWGLWLATLALTLALFVGWEVVMAFLYGRSHFLNSLRFSGGWANKYQLLVPLLGQLGGTLPGVVLLALTALGSDRRTRLLATALIVLSFVLVMVLGSPFVKEAELSPAPTVFIVLGLASVGVIGLVLVRLCAEEKDGSAADSRATRLLLLWLLLEVLGYFVLTPFGAVRRVLGLTVILTLLVGRLAARTLTDPRRSEVRIACGFGIVLGLAYFALDFREAAVQRMGVEDAAAWIQQHGGGRTWYIGHWGWQFYAERHGMQPVIVDYEPAPSRIPLPPPSQLQAGDWLVVPGERVHRQSIELHGAPLQEEKVFRYADGLPLCTVMCFYAGTTPLEHLAGDRLIVRIYRITANFTPRKSAEE